jgi:hypothetical protein
MWSFVENLLFVKQRLLDEPIVINQQNLKFINSIRNPKLKFNLYQTYDVVNHPLNVTSITFEKPEKDDDIPCCSHFLSDAHAAKKVAIIRNKEKNLMFDENVILYYVVLQDGIIRNVINKDLSRFQQMLLARYESRDMRDFVANVNHMKKYGCFCIIIPVIENNKLIIRRYNRWNEDIDHVYDMVSR